MWTGSGRSHGESTERRASATGLVRTDPADGRELGGAGDGQGALGGDVSLVSSPALIQDRLDEDRQHDVILRRNSRIDILRR